MGGWERALRAAGVREAGLRADYGRQRAEVAQYRREAELATRLLLPPGMVPHVIAATAFMHRTDLLLDGEGSVAERRDAAARWAAETAEALAAGRTGNAALRPLVHSAGVHPVLGQRALEFLGRAAADLDFAGFETEADYQRYVDEYSLPAVMVIAGMLGPAGDQAEYRAACRTFIDGSQRLDFANDLAEDLAGGRLAIPQSYLTEHQVSREDLERSRELPAVRALLADQLDRAARSLDAGRAVVGLAPAAHRPMLRCMVELELLTVRAARVDPAALVRRSVGPGKPAALRLLGRCYLQARRAPQE
ncbi:squalene/phytoene synthase family protein [Kitasatospora viridis]|uniref:Phytoene synthase n=1 Tax=Kitasatospora viridis TaxID=281105 RepID=A0A561T728_9ACTN|nr:squalene/phytoene synthase family protein [Kitasatospora viridis]TWF82915.1 phytoene synthase [Kitasatospora viridis]